MNKYGVVRTVNYSSGEVEIQLDNGEWIEIVCNPAEVQDVKADDIVSVQRYNGKTCFTMEG